MNDKPDYLSIAFYIALGIGAVLLYQKRSGDKKVKNEDELEKWQDTARMRLHHYLDELTEGTVDEAEIEKEVYRIIN
jgi:uncharacterized membrane-anchored protein YhcB (DUF1043 family)